MGSFEFDNIASPEVRREIEMRLELWQQLLGSGPPETFRVRARNAGCKVPRPYGFDIKASGSSEFAAETGRPQQEVPDTALLNADIDPAPASDAGPFFEFSVGVSLALRALCAAMVASDDLLVDLQYTSLEKAKPPFPSTSDWRGARDLVRNFSEDAFLALRRSLIKTGLSRQPDREHLVNTLSMQIESFIVLHELGHHRMAHIQFLERRKGRAEISPFLRQVFELEADRNAISTMFNTFCAPSELIDSSNISPEMQALHNMTPASRWRLWTTMVGLLFLILEVSTPGICLPGERRFPSWKFRSAVDHPPPLYRMKHAVTWAKDLVQPQDKAAFESYRLAVDYALADIARMADRLSVEKPLRYFNMETSPYESRLAAARNGVGSELNALLDELGRTEYESP